VETIRTNIRIKPVHLRLGEPTIVALVGRVALAHAAFTFAVSTALDARCILHAVLVLAVHTRPPIWTSALEIIGRRLC